jgi:hypothetical protein
VDAIEFVESLDERVAIVGEVFEGCSESPLALCGDLAGVEAGRRWTRLYA